MVDYWSSYFEVQELHRTTSSSVINAFKVQFARHGIPDTLVTDSGMQFTSAEFHDFATKWDFTHCTSSRHYLQSNGNAENAVKTCKTAKAKVDNIDLLLALLDWRNTPTEGIGTSPAQRLMGRRTRTLLRTHQNLLKPSLPEATNTELGHGKKIQKQKYDKGSHLLPTLKPEQAVRTKLPGSNNWTLGSCVTSLQNRSCEVEIAGRRYRRNRRQL